MILGDFNKKIGNHKLGVTENHPEISAGGKLVRTHCQIRPILTFIFSIFHFSLGLFVYE